MSKTAWAKKMKRESKRNVLADGQGARKKKPAHRTQGSARHKRAFVGKQA